MSIFLIMFKCKSNACRWESQKYKMLRCKARRRFIVIEGDMQRTANLSETEQKACRTAAYHATVFNGFGVWETDGNTQTMELYAEITKALEMLYQQASLQRASGAQASSSGGHGSSAITMSRGFDCLLHWTVVIVVHS